MVYLGSQIKVIGFHHYPSYVQWGVNDSDHRVMALFGEMLKKADEILRKHLMDNKTAFEFIHKPTNTKMYVGCKDGVYTLGLDVMDKSLLPMTKLDFDLDS